MTPRTPRDFRRPAPPFDWAAVAFALALVAALIGGINL